MDISLRDIPARFARHVQAKDETGCWIWTGHIDRSGYAQVKFERKSRVAHRVLFELLFGPVEREKQLDHLCKNRACINPAHLEPVSPRVNVLRSCAPSAIAVRTNRCKRGHELTADNVYTSKLRPGQRSCRTCCLDWQRAHARTRRGTCP